MRALDFYNTLASAPSSSSNIRYGFVTYSSTVNAGAAIMAVSPSYMVGGAGSGPTSATYQSRYVSNQYVRSGPTSAYDSTVQASCNTSVRTPAATSSQPYTFDTSSTATLVTKAWDTTVTPNRCKVTTTTYGPIWTCAPVSYNVSSFLTSASVTDPSKLDGTTNAWQGCSEERSTTAGASSFDVNNLPADLDPDLAPASDTTRWKPMWSEVIYARNYDSSSATSFSSTANATATSGWNGETDKNASYNTSSFSLWY